MSGEKECDHRFGRNSEFWYCVRQGCELTIQRIGDAEVHAIALLASGLDQVRDAIKCSKLPNGDLAGGGWINERIGAVVVELELRARWLG